MTESRSPRKASEVVDDSGFTANMAVPVESDVVLTAEKRSGDKGERLDEFVRMLSENDRGTLLYILSLVPNWADAEEIRQETNVKLWQEFGKFQLGTDFAAWARTIAWYEVLRFRERTQRTRQQASRAFLEMVAAKVPTVVDGKDDRAVVLAKCVEELGSFHRELVRLYYTVGQKIKEIASSFHSTPDATYKALQRARIELRECVNRKLGGEKKV